MLNGMTSENCPSAFWEVANLMEKNRFSTWERTITPGFSTNWKNLLSFVQQRQRSYVFYRPQFLALPHFFDSFCTPKTESK